MFLSPPLSKIIPHNVGILVDQLADEKKNDLTQRLVDWLLKLYPDHFLGLYTKARLALRRGALREASEAYARALEVGYHDDGVDPNNLWLCALGLVGTLWHSDRKNQALTALLEF